MEYEDLVTNANGIRDQLDEVDALALDDALEIKDPNRIRAVLK